MVRAYHVIFSTYGFWLPNDPRGSWSDYVRSWEVFRHGPATKTHLRRSHARDEHDRRKRRAAKRSLRYPPVKFTGRQAVSVAQGFRNAIARSGYRFGACAILPEHVHAVIARCDHDIRKVVGQLKGEATKQLKRDALHPFGHLAAPPSPWVRRGWNVFLDSDEAIGCAIRYVEQNPVKEGKPPQKWSFVVPLI